MLRGAGLMAVKSLKTIKPIYWVPPIYTTNWKLTVERSDGSIDDITDIVIKGKIEDGVTEGIGIFEFEIPNPNNTYTDAWTGMEILRYYSDYAKSATSLRFRGRIEKSSNQNNNIKITGRSESLFVMDQSVNKDYDNEDAGVAIKDLFDTYGQSRFDTSEIDISTGISIILTFSDTPFWDVVTAICLASGYDCYIAPDLKVKFFLAGSIINTTEGIVHEHNLIEVGDFASDLQFVKNKIRVIGGNIDGVQVIYTANDTDSQTTYGIRRETVNDDGIVTFNAAKDLGEFVLNERKDPPIVGEVKGIHLATIQPGEKIRISAPDEGIPPGKYRAVHYKHEIEDGQGYTTATINKEPRKLSHVLKDRIQREHKRVDASINPNDLDFSEIETFNSNLGEHSDTVITGGVLKISSGKSSGIWTSPAYNTPNSDNVDKISIGLVGDNIPGVEIEVSVDNGITFQPIVKDELKDISISFGNTIVIRFTLTEENTQIDSYQIQYSTA